MDNLYISADLNLFNEKEAEKYHMSVEDYNDLIVASWNSVIKDDDYVLLLGVISCGGKNDTSQLIGKLNGKKRIIDYDFQKNKFSKQDWFDIGITEVMNINGWARGVIEGKESGVVICTSKPYYEELVNKYEEVYIAAPSSTTGINEMFSGKTISLSAKFWSFFPINYNDLPMLIDNQLLFKEMQKRDE